MTDLLYSIVAYDNFHYMDKDEIWHVGQFATFEEAVTEAKHIVDEDLVVYRRDSSSADELFSYYTSFGDEPVIQGPAGTPHFSAWDYARERCVEIFAPRTNSERED